MRRRARGAACAGLLLAAATGSAYAAKVQPPKVERRAIEPVEHPIGRAFLESPRWDCVDVCTADNQLEALIAMSPRVLRRSHRADLERLSRDLADELDDVLTAACGTRCADDVVALRATLARVAAARRWPTPTVRAVVNAPERAAPDMQAFGWDATYRIGRDVVTIHCAHDAPRADAVVTTHDGACGLVIAPRNVWLASYLPRHLHGVVGGHLAALPTFEQEVTVGRGRILIETGVDFAPSGPDGSLSRRGLRGAITLTGSAIPPI